VLSIGRVRFRFSIATRGIGRWRFLGGLLGLRRWLRLGRIVLGLILRIRLGRWLLLIGLGFLRLGLGFLLLTRVLGTLGLGLGFPFIRTLGIGIFVVRLFLLIRLLLLLLFELFESAPDELEVVAGIVVLRIQVEGGLEAFEGILPECRAVFELLGLVTELKEGIAEIIEAALLESQVRGGQGVGEGGGGARVIPGTMGSGAKIVVEPGFPGLLLEQALVFLERIGEATVAVTFEG